MMSRLACTVIPDLLLDEDEAVLIDPGSIPDFPIIMRKVIDVTDPSAISHLVASHQDPDVCGNLAVVEDVIDRDDLRIVAHRNTVRLIRHLGLRSEFYYVDDRNFQLVVNSGRVLEFMFTPFLHSPGAMVTYDPKTGSLFSGDIFGAINNHDWKKLSTAGRFNEFCLSTVLSLRGKISPLHSPS